LQKIQAVLSRSAEAARLCVAERLPERRGGLFRGWINQLLDREKEEAGAADSCRAAQEVRTIKQQQAISPAFQQHHQG
jgi:hypothetical protein